MIYLKQLRRIKVRSSYILLLLPAINKNKYTCVCVCVYTCAYKRTYIKHTRKYLCVYVMHTHTHGLASST